MEVVEGKGVSASAVRPVAARMIGFVAAWASRLQSIINLLLGQEISGDEVVRIYENIQRSGGSSEQAATLTGGGVVKVPARDLPPIFGGAERWGECVVVGDDTEVQTIFAFGDDQFS